MRTLVNPGNSNLGYGFGLALEQDLLVVGSPSLITNGIGATYVYQRNRGGPDAWGLMRELQSVASSPSFGASVAISDQTIAVGSDFAERVELFARHQNGHDLPTASHLARVGNGRRRRTVSPPWPGGNAPGNGTRNDARTAAR